MTTTTKQQQTMTTMTAATTTLFLHTEASPRAVFACQRAGRNQRLLCHQRWHCQDFLEGPSGEEKNAGVAEGREGGMGAEIVAYQDGEALLRWNAY